jgi:hypothetical protein
MTITELGALGEFVGAFAVVMTLVYLAVQVRQSAKSAESNAIAQAASDHLANMRVLAENPELAAAYEKAQAGELVEPSVSSQLRWWTVCFLRGIETHVQIAKLGVVSEFEAPCVEILSAMSKDNEMARTLMEGYIGSQTFRVWLDERILK